MTISITLPQLGKPRTAKDAIISILGREWPLSARRIFIKVKSFGMDVSYQAVHKALNELIAENVAQREDNGYMLSESWIESIREFGNKLDVSYKNKATDSLENVINSGYQSLFFNTVIDMYRFILGSIIYFEEYYTQPKHPGVVNYSHMWWALVGSEKEQEMFKKAAAWKNGVYFLCAGETYADKILAKFYEGVKGTDVKVKLGVSCANDCELFIVEDYIIQIYLPLEIKNIIDKSYKEIKLFSSDAFRKLYENIIFKKSEIHVIIFKNPKLAEQIRNKTIGHFKS